MKQAYGLAHGEYGRMLVEQKGVCAACGKPEETKGPTGKTRRLCVDHDHATGKVRGLLCNGCNRAIGNVNDDPETLRRLANYLERSGAWK